MEIARVISCNEITRSWHLLKLQTFSIVDAVPGQFVHIRLSRATDPWLRRPFSIHYLEPGSGSLWLLFQEVGRGTAMLSRLKTGDPVDLMGPLGHGYEIEDTDQRVTLVGGGIGMAPLYFLAGRLQEKGIPFDFLIGASRREVLPDASYFRTMGVTPLRATDDGSQGFHGTVNGLFSKLISGEDRIDRVYACGPTPMLEELVQITRKREIPSQVSLEAFMACGVGACLGCVCSIYSGQDEEYLRVCKEGPVFNGESVILR